MRLYIIKVANKFFFEKTTIGITKRLELLNKKVKMYQELSKNINLFSQVQINKNFYEQLMSKKLEVSMLRASTIGNVE